MKKYIIFHLILLTFFSSALAIDDNYLSFKITPRFELANGIINEYVYDENCLNDDNKLSQLDWDLRAIPVLGINADFNLLRYLYIGFEASMGVPIRSGNMQDYDWLNSVKGDGNYPEWIYDDPRQLTNYSKHNNFLEKYITFSARLGANIFLPAEIKLIPILSYHYEFISFSGKDGYSLYKWNNWQQEPFSGKVISYKQELNSMLLGFAFEVSKFYHIYFYSDFFISPKMTFINCRDYHHRPRRFAPYGVAFWDNISNVFQLQTNIVTQYKFNKHHFAGIKAYLQYIPVSKGDTRTKSLTAEAIPAEGAWSAPYIGSGGTSRLIWSIGLNYSFSL